MIKNNEKQFDCIKMKDNIQAQVYTETMKMTKTELLQYFNKNISRKQANTYKKTVSLVATD
jgi:hypothetical protein